MRLAPFCIVVEAGIKSPGTPRCIPAFGILLRSNGFTVRNKFESKVSQSESQIWQKSPFCKLHYNLVCKVYYDGTWRFEAVLSQLHVFKSWNEHISKTNKMIHFSKLVKTIQFVSCMDYLDGAVSSQLHVFNLWHEQLFNTPTKAQTNC